MKHYKIVWYSTLTDFQGGGKPSTDLKSLRAWCVMANFEYEQLRHEVVECNKDGDIIYDEESNNV